MERFYQVVVDDVVMIEAEKMSVAIIAAVALDKTLTGDVFLKVVATGETVNAIDLRSKY